MAQFQLNILGCGSAVPTMRHLPSCQVLDVRDNLMMIDCGEGAQLSMRRQRLKFSRLHNIFLSHLHGDHCLGLPGLLSTMALHDVGGTVTIHTFADGAKILGETINFFCRERSFDLRFNIIDPRATGIVYADNAVTVETFPLYHRVPCVGFIVREKPKSRHIIGDMVKFYNVPHYKMAELKAGADFVTPDGQVIPNSRLTTAPDPSASYAYCSDTVFDPRVAEAIAGVDVVYHEATYADDWAHKAVDRGHSTASQAAEIARLAGAKLLIIGHYSKSYPDESLHLAQARAIFPNTICANEGLSVDLEAAPSN